ncbi:MAG: replicative DNA helicase [Firmicutes bacterium]|nr:replicative DNA helicase [Bacillota bacterium]
MDRIPPHDLNAEQALLSCLLQDKGTLDKVYEIINTDDFYSDKHKKVYDAILGLNRKNEPFDAITVGSYLDNIDQLTIVGGLSYLLSLTNEVPVTTHAEYYAKIVVEKSTLRQLIATAKDITEEVYKGEHEVENILDKSEQFILDIANKKKRSGFSRVGDILHTAFDKLETLKNKDNQIIGIPTFNDLDKLLNGFQPSDMIIVAARPGVGKTSFCLNIAENAAVNHNKTVGVFSLEMSKEQLVLRLLSSQALVDQTKIRKGTVNQNEFDDLTAAANVLLKAPIFIDDTAGINIMEIRGKARRLQQEHGLDLIIIDYLQLMQSGGSGRKSENRQQEISDISRNIKLLARELNVPIVALSQLSRAVEQSADKRPNLSHLRESGSLEQDSDVVLFIYRQAMNTSDEDNDFDDKTAEIIIGKHRHGATGKVKMVFLNEYTKFVNIEGSLEED